MKCQSREEIVERFRTDPLRRPITDFVLANKPWVSKPGALGEMVALLARLLNIPLDAPTPPPSTDGTGIPGVDPNLGPIHLIVEPPSGALRIQKFVDFRGQAPAASAETAARFGLDPQTLQKHEAALQAAMPASQSLWVNVPDEKVAAFTAELEAKGFRVDRARPKYRLTHETGPLSGMPGLREKTGLTGKGVLVAYLDEGGNTTHPGLAAERVKHKRNFSDEGAADEVDAEGIGHGTHGMGIVGGTAVEGSPYLGMAPGVDFAIGKVLGSNGGSEATVMAGMEWAGSLAEDPLKTPVLVNMSPTLTLPA